MPSGESVEIARKLTKASRRALLRIDKQWTEEGSPGPSRKDAYSLGWGRNGNLKLVERMPFAIGSCGCSWKYRLTPLGAQVRALLERNPHVGE